jgi:hypothetical protein
MGIHLLRECSKCKQSLLVCKVFQHQISFQGASLSYIAFVTRITTTVYNILKERERKCMKDRVVPFAELEEPSTTL